MKNKTILSLCLMAALVGVLITSCKPKSKTSDKPVVFVTIDPLRYFAETIAGKHYHIISMVPPGSSPETYDPSPQQILELTESKVYLAVGKLGFEQQWIPKLKENAPYVKFCDTSEGIQYTNSTHHHEGEIDGVDPHTWTTPSSALIISKNIYNLFCEIDPEHQDEYTQNYTQLVTQILQTDAEIRKIIDEGIQNAFAIYHPTLTYFANDYGLEQLSIENEGKEPSPAQLKHLIQHCKSEGVKTIFIQQEFNTHNAEIIAKEIKAKLVSINPLSYDWNQEIIKIANTLKK